MAADPGTKTDPTDPTDVITEENLTPTKITPIKVNPHGKVTRYPSADEGFHTVSGPQYAARPVEDRSHSTLNEELKAHDSEYYTDELLSQLTLNDKLFAVRQNKGEQL